MVGTTQHEVPVERHPGFCSMYLTMIFINELWLIIKKTETYV